jgi:hypothetical protein
MQYSEWHCLKKLPMHPFLKSDNCLIQQQNTLGLNGKQHEDPGSTEPHPVMTQPSHDFKGRLHAQS